MLFLEEVWRWEESSVKIKKLEGGWGGGRGASPPDALGVVAFVRVACLVVFFIILLPQEQQQQQQQQQDNTSSNNNNYNNNNNHNHNHP